MARSDDDDILEPILPKHPPVVVDPGPEEAVATEVPAGPPSGASWPRAVLLACAVVATLALVFCAVQLSSIAEDQRLQACQVRAYAEDAIVNEQGGSPPRRTELRERFAECLGIELESEDEDDAARTGDD